MKYGTVIRRNVSLEGETIEDRVEKILSSKEPISDSADIIYTDRKDGVLPDYDPRTDKWDYAIDAMDKVSKSRIAKRDEIMQKRDEKPVEKPEAAVNSGTSEGGK